MNKFVAALFAFVAAVAAQGQSASASPDLSPAARRIAEARSEIREKPAQYAGYNLLASALINRARETSDATYYAQAEVAVKTSLELAPNNFDTGKVRVSLLLAEHEFPAALDAARALNQRVPDDVMVYGMLTDANIELGIYKDAETSAHWMLDLRPGNLPALLYAARLRELFGDAEGAYELMDLAYQSTSPTDSEQRASILAQMGHLRFASGNSEAAEKLLQQALVFSASDFSASDSSALGTLALIRIAQKRYPEAVTLLRQRYQSAPRPGNLFELAEALQLAGREAEATKSFAEFEAEALQETKKKHNSNRELIFYYADHADQPAKALNLGQQEFAWRHDVYTLDAYAWALHVNGQQAEARKQIEVALAVGIRDAKLFLHAGQIALALQDVSAAERYLKQAADLNSPDSEQARTMLAGIAPMPAQR